jgi:4-amino-4-deoxy-L-arabinose transferase-like glycosyltransferase
MERVFNKNSLIILLLLWLLFVALPIGNRGLWAPDEPRYLQVAWEMARNQSYLIPIMNGEIYAEKPPLFFWLTILVSKVTSFETASRWVSALASLGILLLTYLLGQISGNKKIGLTAALILMTSSLYTLLMHTGNIDTTLTFLTTLSLFFFLKWDLEKKSRFLIAAYVTCGIGILAKGPVALIVPWLAYIIWELIKYIRKEQASFFHLLWGPLIALTVAAAWVVPACIVGGEEYTQIILFKQQMRRAVQADVHQRPWYEYLLFFGPNTLPWFVAMLGAVPELKQKLKEKNRYILLYVVWFCTIFIFFSLVSSKRERYLLPIYPVFSLLIAHSVSNWVERKEASKSIQIVGIITLIGVASVLLFPLMVPFFKDTYPTLNIFPVEIADWRLWVSCAMGIVAATIIFKGIQQAKAKRHLLASNLIALGILIIIAIGQVYYIPNIEPVKSARRASQKINTLLPKDGSVAFYRRRLDNGWNFYLNKEKIPIITDQDIARKQPRYDVIILKQKHMDLLKAVLKMENYKIAAVEPVGSTRFVLLKYNAN